MSKEFDYPRDFKGIWIPKEIWLDDDLNAIDKIIFAEIYSLDVEGSDGCYASNEYLSNFCKCGITKVSTSISKLIKRGYIKVAKTDGRTRWLKASLSKFESQTNKNKKSELQKMKESNIDNNKDYNNTLKDNSFFRKKVMDRNKIINPAEIEQEEMKKRIYNVVEKLREYILDDEQADNVLSCMTYFIEQYAEIFGRQHPVLSEEIINNVAANITKSIEIEHKGFFATFDPLVPENYDDEAYEEIIDMYFTTEFKQDIDYSIVHFSQENVLVKLMGKATNKVWYQNN